MARIATNPAESRGFLWHAVTPPRRGCDLPVPTRRPHAGSRRAHANRLCSWSLPARLAHTVGLSAPGFASSRLGHQHGLRRLCASDCFPSGSQPVWPQSFGLGAASPLLARIQGRPLSMDTSPKLSGSHLGRRPVRLRRIVAGRVSQSYLLARNPSECTPAWPTERRTPDRLSGLRCRPEWQRQQAAHCLRQSLQQRDIDARLVRLPEGHDPNSFFTQGGDARQFQGLLEATRS